MKYTEEMNAELYAGACDGWCDPRESGDAEYADTHKPTRGFSLSAEVAEMLAEGASHADIEGVLADFYED